MKVYSAPGVLYCRECRMPLQVVETIELETDNYDAPKRNDGEPQKRKILCAIWEHGRYDTPDCPHKGKRFQNRYHEFEVNSFRVVPPS